MALPKEPRQKMINMMYLVLTALLALNVSSEILNAFVTVNGSILKSNDLIAEKNKGTYAAFAAELADPQTKAKAEIWAPKAKEVEKYSSELFSYIEGLKAELEKQAGTHESHVTGKPEINADNIDAAIRLMDQMGKGKELYAKLGEYKKNILAVLASAQGDSLAANVKEQIKRDAEKFNTSLPIDLNIPASKTGAKYSNDAAGWTQSYFHMTPAIAALTILSKFQNDVKSSEAQLVDYIHQQVGQVKVVYDEFEAIAQANTSYAMPGDKIEITAGVGAFSAAAKPEISIAGANVPLTGGKAIYKTTASGTGEHSIAVKIKFTKPDGSIATKDEIVKYTVGIPSGASVFLEKMNVLYIGVDNPLTISGGSAGAEKTSVSFADGSISKSGAAGHWVAKPNKPGMSKIVVTADGKRFEFPMRLKYLPPPAAFVGAKKGGSIGAAELKAIGAVIAKLEDSDFEAPYKVVSYTVGAVGGPLPMYQTFPNEGNRWSGQAASLISRCGPGTRVFFDQIQVVGPDGRKREIPSLNFLLK
jgi:gliding motility-associated protein GldM